MDYSKLSDRDIDALVLQKTHGNQSKDKDIMRAWLRGGFKYTTNPADAWPILVENNISLILDNPSSPMATSNCVGWYSDEEPPIHASNQNPLRAAMIVFLMMQESANVQDNPAR